MTAKTRYFVAGSLVVLGVGISAGLVAYFMASPGLAGRLAVENELELVPEDTTLLAYADVREVMLSELRERLRLFLPFEADGRNEFLEETGINIETDVDRVLFALAPAPVDAQPPVAALVIARGRFDESKIQSLMLARGAQVQEHRSHRLIVAGDAPDSGIAVSFIETGLAAVGSAHLVRAAIDRADGGPNVRNNAQVMELVRGLDAGNVWAVGRIDTLLARANLPGNVLQNLPAVSWFSVNAHVNGGIRGAVRLETLDEASATQLRDLVRGLVALAKLHGPSSPEVQSLLNSLQPGGTGTTVALAFDVPSTVFDSLPSPPANRQ